jgi:guanylate kinase
MPPSVEELERRLRGRGTDTEEVIMKRIAKAEFELSKASEFDYTVVNDVLEDAVEQTVAIISQFLK